MSSVKILFPFFQIGIIVVLLSCSNNPVQKTDDKNTTSSIRITGTMQHHLGKSATGVIGIENADSIYALPGVGGIFTLGFDKMEAAKINTDGTFAIDLPKKWDPSFSESETEWILLLIDSKATAKFDKIVGYLSLREIDQSLIEFPISHSRSDSINMGNVTTQGDEAKSDSTIPNDTAKFSLTLSQLKTMARTGKTLKMIKNYYSLYSPGQKDAGWSVSPQYNFAGEVDLDLAKNTELLPSGYIDIQKVTYGINFRTGDVTTWSSTNIYNGTVSLDLYPPIAVKMIVDTSGATVDIPSFVSTDTSKDPHISNDPYSSGYPSVMPWGVDGGATQQTISFGGFKGMMPNGVWTANQNTNGLIAQFDLGLGNPFDSLTNQVNVYVPSVKVIVNGSNVVTQVDIKWYYWDLSSSSYVQVTDPVLIKNGINYASIGVCGPPPTLGHEGTSYGSEYGNSTDDTVPITITYIPQQTWAYDKHAFQVQFSYETGGQTFCLYVGSKH